MFVDRKLKNYILKLSKKFPVLCINGPRQSGKTTLVKKIFSEYKYVTLENPDDREFAYNDPRGFFEKFKSKTIIDEIQNVPDLFSYMQEIVDKNKKNGQYILTGSNNFLLLENITQSLAGRIAILKLLPFSISELQNTKFYRKKITNFIFKGGYPPLYDRNINPIDFYPQYINTYIERDVRQIKNIQDLNTFQHFLKLCAGQIGKEINLTNISNDCGKEVNTIKSWISILEASYIVFRLPPHYKNFNKRLRKTPKLYFYDTGIACNLLGIRNIKDLDLHFAKGELFENFILVELMKKLYNTGNNTQLYYWKDKTGNEIDCIIERANEIIPIEIKSGKTIKPSFFNTLNYWNKLANNKPENSYIIYGGDKTQKRKNGNIIPWYKITDFNIDNKNIFGEI